MLRPKNSPLISHGMISISTLIYSSIFWLLLSYLSSFFKLLIISRLEVFSLQSLLDIFYIRGDTKKE
jgi:hypothetical protein